MTQVFLWFMNFFTISQDWTWHIRAWLRSVSWPMERRSDITNTTSGSALPSSFKWASTEPVKCDFCDKTFVCSCVGHPFLHSKVLLEDLGGWKDQAPGSRHECAHRGLWNQGQEDQLACQLFQRESLATHFLRAQVCQGWYGQVKMIIDCLTLQFQIYRLWRNELGKRDWSNIFYGPLLG